MHPRRSLALPEAPRPATNPNNWRKSQNLALNENNPSTPEGIYLMIGRRPYAAFGNSTDNRQILEFPQLGMRRGWGWSSYTATPSTNMPIHRPVAYPIPKSARQALYDEAKDAPDNHHPETRPWARTWLGREAHEATRVIDPKAPSSEGATPGPASSNQHSMRPRVGSCGNKRPNNELDQASKSLNLTGADLVRPFSAQRSITRGEASGATPSNAAWRAIHSRE